MAQEANRDRLNSRLENWARWCRSRDRVKGRCLSIEHRYRSPQWGHWDSAPPQNLPDIDLLDAGLVEDAVSSLPLRFKKFFVYLYVKRFSERRVMSKLIKFGVLNVEFYIHREIANKLLINAIELLINAQDKKIKNNILWSNSNLASGPIALAGRF